jgi:hypothetical protein
MLGSYVASPNYGLLDDSTVPSEELPRHQAISFVPVVIYALFSWFFAVRPIGTVNIPSLIVQWAVFAFVGSWLASRSGRIWRVLGVLAVALFILNSALSLINLALIGDPLPGGDATPGGLVNHAQVLGEYGGTALALIFGWLIGARQRRAMRFVDVARAV